MEKVYAFEIGFLEAQAGIYLVMAQIKKRVDLNEDLFVFTLI